VVDARGRRRKLTKMKTVDPFKLDQVEPVLANIISETIKLGVNSGKLSQETSNTYYKSGM